jgi:hypothetical protein
MATASSTSSTAAATSGQGAGDNCAATGQPGEATSAGGQSTGDSSGTAPFEGGAPLADDRGTFFDIFKGQLGTCCRFCNGNDGRDVLEPLDSQGKPLLGDDGRPMTTTEFLDQMRVHPVYGFLFQQRSPAGMQAARGLTVSGIGSNGEPINPQAMSASELYRASFAVNGRGARH